MDTRKNRKNKQKHPARNSDKDKQSAQGNLKKVNLFFRVRLVGPLRCRVKSLNIDRFPSDLPKKMDNKTHERVPTRSRRYTIEFHPESCSYFAWDHAGTMWHSALLAV